jgi:hypothetical protein
VPIAWTKVAARLAAPERPLALAALRIAVVGLLVVTSEPHDAIEAARTHAPVVAPEGIGWLVDLVPLREDLLALVARVYRTAAVLALLGVFTRAAMAVLLVTAFLLFAAAQLTGAVLHDMHLLWFLAILCASGAADRALSVDAWVAQPVSLGWRRRLLGPREADPACGTALFFVRTLLGLVYFFPGFWKLRVSGLAWAFSDNLANQMHAKWLEFGAVPWPRVDRVPALVHAMGAFTLLFELGFLFLVHLGPAARLALVAVGLAFHLGIEHFLFIPFASLWVTYVALLPWPRDTPPRAPSSPDGLAREARAVATVGAAIALAVAVQGVRGRTQAFPFACYPTFQAIAAPTLPDLVITAVSEDGGAREVPHGRDAQGRRSQREWGMVWSVAGLYGEPFDEARLRAYLLAEARRPAVRAALVDARNVQATIVDRPTDPADWALPPRRVRDVATFPLGP